jgi:hypothetical protein
MTTVQVHEYYDFCFLDNYQFLYAMLLWHTGLEIESCWVHTSCHLSDTLRTSLSSCFVAKLSSALSSCSIARGAILPFNSGICRCSNISFMLASNPPKRMSISRYRAMLVTWLDGDSPLGRLVPTEMFDI